MTKRFILLLTQSFIRIIQPRQSRESGINFCPPRRISKNSLFESYSPRWITCLNSHDRLEVLSNGVNLVIRSYKVIRLKYSRSVGVSKVGGSIRHGRLATKGSIHQGGICRNKFNSPQEEHLSADGFAIKLFPPPPEGYIRKSGHLAKATTFADVKGMHSHN